MLIPPHVKPCYIASQRNVLLPNWVPCRTNSVLTASKVTRTAKSRRHRRGSRSIGTRRTPSPRRRLSARQTSSPRRAGGLTPTLGSSSRIGERAGDRCYSQGRAIRVCPRDRGFPRRGSDGRGCRHCWALGLGTSSQSGSRNKLVLLELDDNIGFWSTRSGDGSRVWCTINREISSADEFDSQGTSDSTCPVIRGRRSSSVVRVGGRRRRHPIVLILFRLIIADLDSGNRQPALPSNLPGTSLRTPLTLTRTTLPRHRPPHSGRLPQPKPNPTHPSHSISDRDPRRRSRGTHMTRRRGHRTRMHRISRLVDVQRSRSSKTRVRIVGRGRRGVATDGQGV